MDSQIANAKANIPVIFVTEVVYRVHCHSCKVATYNLSNPNLAHPRK